MTTENDTSNLPCALPLTHLQAMLYSFKTCSQTDTLCVTERSDVVHSRSTRFASHSN